MLWRSAVCWLCAWGSAAVASVVDTSFGKLVGRYEPLRGCDVWLGVPFAEPPIGDLRFEAPQPWRLAYPQGGYEARRASQPCPQRLGGDEDCLHLNVWRPHGTTSGEGLAVMVWIHGGTFEVGSGDQPGFAGLDMYDGCKLATRQGLVVVSINYRLGPLGFTAFERPDSSLAANFGIEDQREALRWIRREASAFGGDPAKVTIFGQSAGAISVMHHMASPLSRGLFRAGISESGLPFASCRQRGLARTAALAAKLGCNRSSSGVDGGGAGAALLGCLRSKSAEEIIAAAKEDPANPLSSPSLAWWPVIDGVDMPEYPVKLYSEGRTNRVPLLAGTVTDEADAFVWPAFEEGMSEMQYRKYVEEFNEHIEPAQKMIPAEMDEAMRTYPPSPDGDNKQAAATLITDSTFLCGTRTVADKHSAYADTFVYRFNHRSGCLWEAAKIVPGVFHGIEIPYVFGDPGSTACRFEREEEALSQRMQEMWANFAKHLSPSTETRGFPRYTAASRRSLLLETPSDSVEARYRNAYCELWYNLSWSKLIATPGDSDLRIVV